MRRTLAQTTVARRKNCRDGQRKTARIRQTIQWQEADTDLPQICVSTIPPTLDRTKGSAGHQLLRGRSVPGSTVTVSATIPLRHPGRKQMEAHLASASGHLVNPGAEHCSHTPQMVKILFKCKTTLCATQRQTNCHGLPGLRTVFHQTVNSPIARRAPMGRGLACSLHTRTCDRRGVCLHCTR